MDPSVQQALLQDPRVKAELQKAGENALNDPAVQNQILETCKEKFPQYAAQAQAQVTAWANDPAVQAQAKEYANTAAAYVGAAAGSAGSEFMNKIEQGPTGVRVLAFCGSAASMVMCVFSLINLLDVVTHPVTYLFCAYQFLFAFTTSLFEMPPEWVEKIQQKVSFFAVEKYQTLLMENAKFLATSGGRGVFYIFQGTLWLAMAGLTDFLKYIIGAYLCFMGVLHVLMHVGVMPKTVAQKMRGGYQSFAGTQGPPAPPGP